LFDRPTQYNDGRPGQMIAAEIAYLQSPQFGAIC
jgi:hypothetical protein